jgi:hypothetical protein
VGRKKLDLAIRFQKIWRSGSNNDGLSKNSQLKIFAYQVGVGGNEPKNLAVAML